MNHKYMKPSRVVGIFCCSALSCHIAGMKGDPSFSRRKVNSRRLPSEQFLGGNKLLLFICLVVCMCVCFFLNQ